jgi:dihydrofolate synthase/folylpolyglutamate synthase
MSDGVLSCVGGLLERPKFGTGIGFHRLQLLLEPLMESDWGRSFTTIRITGSNGKGSVAALLHSILHELDLDCGRYTSPHLVRFNERIVIGDREITDAEIEAAVAWIDGSIHRLGAALEGNEFGSFELITAVCARSFFQAKISLGVIEAGIGGRYDPTRIFPGALVALTSVDLEHTDLLGNSKELIACDKIDLCPDGGTIVSVRREAPLWERIRAYCRLRRLNLVDANESWQVERVESIAPAGNERTRGMRVRIARGGRSVCATTRLVGTFQLDNIAIACSLAEHWVRAFRPGISEQDLMDAFARGLERVEWPGRFEQISDEPPVFIDVGHSPDACSRLIETVQTFLKDAPILLVTGVSHNKSVDKILKILVPTAHAVICTRAHHKGEQVGRIAEIVHGIDPAKELFEAATIEDAAVLAKQIAEARRMTVLVAGGLFLSIEFKAAWQGGDPTLLRFY